MSSALNNIQTWNSAFYSVFFTMNCFLTTATEVCTQNALWEITLLHVYLHHMMPFSVYCLVSPMQTMSQKWESFSLRDFCPQLESHIMRVKQSASPLWQRLISVEVNMCHALICTVNAAVTCHRQKWYGNYPESNTDFRVVCREDGKPGFKALQPWQYDPKHCTSSSSSLTVVFFRRGTFSVGDYTNSCIFCLCHS